MWVSTRGETSVSARGDRPDGASMSASGRGRWVGLAMLSVGVAMIIVDATIVNVAVPSIIRELKLDSTQAEWINTTYALVFAALLITLGRLGDVFGPAPDVPGRPRWCSSSPRCWPGLAPTGDLLILARILQGVGGAMILPSTQAILNANFQGRDRAIAFGIWGSVIGGMAAVGPLLGGFLTTYLSWRWAFFINLPVGLLAIAGTLHYIGESKDEHARPGFDLPGFLLITLGLGRVRLRPDRGPPVRLVDAECRPSVRRPRLDLAARHGLGHPVRARLPASLALVAFAVVETRRRGAGKFYPVRLQPVAVPRLPLRQPGRHDRVARRVRPAVRAAALPPGRPRLLGVRDGPRLPRAGDRRVLRGAAGAATFARRYGPRWVVTTGHGPRGDRDPGHDAADLDAR